MAKFGYIQKYKYLVFFFVILPSIFIKKQKPILFNTLHILKQKKKKKKKKKKPAGEKMLTREQVEKKISGLS